MLLKILHMIPENAATIFHISDLEKAIKYYVEVLGFKIAFRYEELAGLEYGNVLIHLSGPNQGGNKRATGEGHIYIFCAEVDLYFQDISAKKTLLLTEPGIREYGLRDFAIKDFDGNILAFGKGIDDRHWIPQAKDF